MHLRIAEGEALHFLAGDAPVGIKIEHHRLSLLARLCQRGLQRLYAGDALKLQPVAAPTGGVASWSLRPQVRQGLQYRLAAGRGAHQQDRRQC